MYIIGTICIEYIRTQMETPGNKFDRNVYDVLTHYIMYHRRTIYERGGGEVLPQKKKKKLPRGVEPRTCCLLSNRSNQLSYESLNDGTLQKIRLQ